MPLASPSRLQGPGIAGAGAEHHRVILVQDFPGQGGVHRGVAPELNALGLHGLHLPGHHPFSSFILGMPYSSSPPGRSALVIDDHLVALVSQPPATDRPLGPGADDRHLLAGGGTRRVLPCRAVMLLHHKAFQPARCPRTGSGCPGCSWTGTASPGDTPGSTSPAGWRRSGSAHRPPQSPGRGPWR